MAEEKKEPWINYLALSTVILAVCATFATFKGGGYSTRSVMNQSRASDQWAFYQSKSIKGYLYEIQKNFLELEVKKINPKDTSLIDDYNKKIEEYSGKIQKYETEKAEIQEEARKFESIRDESQKHSGKFGMAVIFLQISILFSSIAALLKKKTVWYLGLMVGAAGIINFVNGFFLFF